MGPGYYSELSAVKDLPLVGSAVEDAGTPEPDSGEQEVALSMAASLAIDHTALGPFFVSLENESGQAIREQYAARDAELAQAVARRLKLGAFATQKVRDELDRQIDAKVKLYEIQSGLLDQLQIERWRENARAMSDEELERRLARYQSAKEYLHDLRTKEAFHEIRHFGTLSAWNDKLSEWYLGLSHEYKIITALGTTAASAAASGAAAWSGEAFGPTAAFIGGGMLAGVKLYKVYGQARLGLYQDMRENVPASEKAPGKIARAMGRASLAATQKARRWWGSVKQRLASREGTAMASASDSDAQPTGSRDDAQSLVASDPQETVRIQAMSRMERRRRERIEHAEKVNKRARVAIIGAGILTAAGIGSRFIDFGKFLEGFSGGPPVAGSPSPSPTPTPSVSATGTPEAPGVTMSPSPSPPSELPPHPPTIPSPAPEAPMYSQAALTVEDGEGWYQTFDEMGIADPTAQADLLQVAGPELAAHGWAYLMPDGEYGIAKPGMLPSEALDLIASDERKLVG